MVLVRLGAAQAGRGGPRMSPKRSSPYRELDEIEAPEAIPEAGIEEGQEGVVVLELYSPHAWPRHAIEVEFAGPDGEPIAFAVYTTDLGRLLSVHVPGTDERDAWPERKHTTEGV